MFRILKIQAKIIDKSRIYGQVFPCQNILVTTYVSFCTFYNPEMQLKAVWLRQNLVRNIANPNAVYGSRLFLDF